MPRIVALSLLVLLAGAVACATVPAPTETVSNAELAVRKAEQVDAGRHAPLELRKARDMLEEARHHMARENHVEARRLAEQALVEAQLAEARAQAERRKADATAMRESIESLREETERAGERLR
jgi:hypothetical protein